MKFVAAISKVQNVFEYPLIRDMTIDSSYLIQSKYYQIIDTKDMTCEIVESLANLDLYNYSRGWLSVNFRDSLIEQFNRQFKYNGWLYFMSGIDAMFHYSQYENKGIISLAYQPMLEIDTSALSEVNKTFTVESHAFYWFSSSLFVYRVSFDLFALIQTPFFRDEYLEVGYYFDILFDSSFNIVGLYPIKYMDADCYINMEHPLFNTEVSAKYGLTCGRLS